MRITLVNQHPAYALGGSEVQTAQIAESLARLGHEVQYVCPTIDGHCPPVDDLAYTLLGCRPKAEDIARTALSFSPDVVYWRFNRREARATIARIQSAGIPAVFAASSVDDLLKWRSPSRRRPGLSGMRGLLDHRRNHRAVSEARALTVNNQAFLSLAPDAVYVPNIWEPVNTTWDRPRPYVAWVSNLKPPKRPELFVRLAEELSDLDLDFLMAGKPSSDYSWIRDYAGPGSVEFLGQVEPETVSRLLSSAALHVHTCGPEGFPNVFIQAWIHGTPSVTYEFDPAGLIREQRLGGCADGDWDLFVSTVRRLLVDDGERDAVGARAKAFATREFSESHALPLLLRVLNSVARNA